jgi:hypothetical protein
LETLGVASLKVSVHQSGVRHGGKIINKVGGDNGYVRAFIGKCFCFAVGNATTTNNKSFAPSKIQNDGKH